MCQATNASAGSPAAATNQANVTTQPEVELHPEEETDDGASDATSIASSSTSVTDSILSYRLENGRTYHKYKDGKYVYPNDDREIERLDLQHNMFVRTFDGQLGTAPPCAPDAKVGRVLDCGTGSGIWAIDFGDEHPEAEVLGIDLSAVVPQFVPPNVKFEIDDLEELWTYSQPFDYIHSRMMTSSINDWRVYLQQCYDNLTPGGWLELNEVDKTASDDGTLRPDSALKKCTGLWAEAAKKLGRSFQDIPGLKDIMLEIGFEDVHVQRFKWPMNPWPKDPKYKELGAWCHENFSANWEGFIMAPLTRALGWTREEVLVLAMEVRNELRDRRIHAYAPIYSIYGRKPLKKEGDQPAGN